MLSAASCTFFDYSDILPRILNGIKVDKQDMPRRQTHNPFTRGISYVFASWIYFNAAYTRSTLFTADGASLGSMPSNEPQVEPINLSVLREAAHGSFTLAALDTSNADIFHAPLTYDDWNTPTVTATASQKTRNARSRIVF